MRKRSGGAVFAAGAAASKLISAAHGAAISAAASSASAQARVATSEPIADIRRRRVDERRDRAVHVSQSATRQAGDLVGAARERRIRDARGERGAGIRKTEE